MNYGSTTTADGTPLITPKVITGLCVENNKLVNFDFAEDQAGNKVTNRFTISFEQSNGYKFNVSFLDSNQDWAIQALNRDILHICTKIVTIEEYNEVVKDVKDFEEFVTAIRDKIMKPNYGKLFDLKIVYNQNKSSGKFYAGFPKIPAWIDTPGNGKNSFKDNPAYDFYTIPAGASNATSEPTATEPSSLF